MANVNFMDILEALAVVGTMAQEVEKTEKESIRKTEYRFLFVSDKLKGIDYGVIERALDRLDLYSTRQSHRALRGLKQYMNEFHFSTENDGYELFFKVDMVRSTIDFASRLRGELEMAIHVEIRPDAFKSSRELLDVFCKELAKLEQQRR